MNEILGINGILVLRVEIYWRLRKYRIQRGLEQKKMEEMMLKLNEFSHNHHPGRVMVVAKYIRHGISV